MRMRCSLRECVYDAVYVFVKLVKSAKPSLPNPNNHYRFQMIILVGAWFKSISQLIITVSKNKCSNAKLYPANPTPYINYSRINYTVYIVQNLLYNNEITLK